jgi:cysteine-rich repeat protein
MNIRFRSLAVLLAGGVVGLTACSVDPREYVDRADASVTGTDAATTSGEPSNTAIPSTPDADMSVADADVTAMPDAALADTGTSACSSSANCDDGNPCNGSEDCQGGACVSGDTAANGTDCSADDEARVCVLGNCIVARCGDGLADPSGDEECDDGNEVSNDGCEVDCKHSCDQDEDCPAPPVCVGAATCDPDLKYCVAGGAVEDLTSCGDGMVCSAGACVLEGCGNGEVETGEECDDGNLVLNDGCNQCTFSCKQDTDCDNHDACDGTETCDLEQHVCIAGDTITCDDGDQCTVDACDATLGCVTSPVDEDEDGHSPGKCGDDCDDGDKTVFGGAPELCDDKDNNCNDAKDETELNWYKDCDGDGYAVLGAIANPGCEEPAAPTDCGSGLAAKWTTRVPSSAGESDCWDQDPLVHPRTEEENNSAWSATPITGRSVGENFDYNCLNSNEPRYTTTAVATNASCSALVLIPLETQLSTTSELLSSSEGVDWLSTPLLNAGGQIIIKPALCLGTSGWTGKAAPGCGLSGNYSACSGATGSCVRSSSSVTQQCR